MVSQDTDEDDILRIPDMIKKTVTAGYFQAYSNIEKTVRSNPQDLLASQAITTAALSLPAWGPGITPAAKKTQQKLLGQLAGENSPEARFRTIPFEREASRLEQCIKEADPRTPHHAHGSEADDAADQLLPHSAEVLRSGAQSVRPRSVSGVLCAYTRLFELIAASVLAHFKSGGKSGLTAELVEAMAAVDRLGSFCFTGDKRVPSGTTFRYLGTMESIKHHAFPYTDPGRLNMAGQGSFGTGRVFMGRIWKLLQKRGRSVALSDDQREKLRKGRLCLDDWEASGQNRTAAFSSGVGAQTQPRRMRSWELSRDHHDNNCPSGAAVDGEELAGRPGHGSTPRESKRKAVESEIARESKRRKAKETCINFECKFPLSSGLPDGLERGFKQPPENSGHMKASHAGLINHYKEAHRLLEELQGKARGRAPPEEARIKSSDSRKLAKKVKQKRGGMRAALLAIRMLWFLESDQLVWNKAQGLEKKVEEATMYSTQYVREATGKL
ncbi:hypothetical protein TARUN_1097 [Trichoderma arundinaceum]|uniref:Uncharacterized protein n=1 Tax=Trichoderma arundinaceum TaxID=490622 RepID=A0A395P040_TRIAR|nr:hypothetical protein TARUN_1097 [Trichoderma arundinaceum]